MLIVDVEYFRAPPLAISRDARGAAIHMKRNLVQSEHGGQDRLTVVLQLVRKRIRQVPMPCFRLGYPPHHCYVGPVSCSWP